ncbi:MAG: hypothetical protein Q4P65_01775 [Eubacteriales bacterium]|nr:hypothetical protein [Eubacteriales bacterium]
MNRFFTLFKYYTLSYYRDASAAFWTLGFGIILATILGLTVGRIPAAMEIKEIKVGYREASLASSALEDISFVKLNKYTEGEPSQLIDEHELDAFLDTDDILVINKVGLMQEILEQILSQVKQISALGPEAQLVDFNAKWVENKVETSQTIGSLFINILALFSFYSYFAAIDISNKIQANLSTFGQRVALASVTKSELLAAFSLTSICINIFNNLCLMAYIQFILQKKVITNLPLTLLVLLASSFIGLGFGYLVGAVPKLNEQAKTMFGVFVLMFLNTLCGLMNPSLRIIIRTKFPLLDKLNPASVIYRAYTAVNKPEQLVGSALSLIYLLGISLVFMSVSVFVIRRRKFKSLGA